MAVAVAVRDSLELELNAQLLLRLLFEAAEDEQEVEEAVTLVWVEWADGNRCSLLLLLLAL